MLKEIKKKTSNKKKQEPVKLDSVFSQQLLSRKHETGRIPSNIKPVEYTEDQPKKPISRYPNRTTHPEFQRIDLVAGANSALMKQHEINEELLRALIDIQIAGLPKTAKKEMLEKHGKLI